MKTIITFFILFNLNYGLTNSQNTNNPEFKIIITGSKKTYEVLEPIFIKFHIINTSQDSLNIYDMFDPEVIQSNFIIENNAGRTWNKNLSKFDLARLTPTNILATHDTMLISMPVNNWCESLNPELNRRYEQVYGNVGYFPEDNYKIKYSKDGIESNTISFEVKSKDYDDTSSFNEYYHASKLYKKYSKVTYKKDVKIDDLVSDYFSFIEDYPESYYLISDRFMAPFYITLFDASPDFKKVIKQIKQKIDSGILNEFLDNTKVIQRIKKIISYYNRTEDINRLKKSNDN